MKTYSLMLFLELVFGKRGILVYIFIITEKITAPLTSTLIILNLYLNETIKSVAICNAEKFLSKVGLSSLFYLLEYHIIGDE